MHSTLHFGNTGTAPECSVILFLGVLAKLQKVNISSLSIHLHGKMQLPPDKFS